MSGYSGTPLAKKLGIKPASRVALLDAPAGYPALLEPLPVQVTFEARPTAASDLVHLFVADQKQLAAHLLKLRTALKPDAVLWVSWPKKSSKLPSTVTEDSIREAALPLGFVDVKVCAVDETWSGLKLVVRKELR